MFNGVPVVENDICQEVNQSCFVRKFSDVLICQGVGESEKKI
jgi:hypothetical protein